MHIAHKECYVRTTSHSSQMVLDRTSLLNPFLLTWYSGRFSFFERVDSLHINKTVGSQNTHSLSPFNRCYLWSSRFPQIRHLILAWPFVVSPNQAQPFDSRAANLILPIFGRSFKDCAAVHCITLIEPSHFILTQPIQLHAIRSSHLLRNPLGSHTRVDTSGQRSHRQRLGIPFDSCTTVYGFTLIASY